MGIKTARSVSYFDIFKGNLFILKEMPKISFVRLAVAVYFLISNRTKDDLRLE
jgi:hypothetical protein